ncbi:elongin-B-like [Clavelina lepadiformis]|uniref:Ubiquitin-like domain-containing protein n=1 Tax=Clavelina lepadiformis TaxID=159417 RepID=A0ABP0GRY6_CLALP
MEVFFTIRRSKTTIFADAKESNTVLDLKKIIQGILKISPDDQALYDGTNEQVLDDSKTLADSGYTQQTAKAQAPAVLKLAVKEGDTVEAINIVDYSSPPELPDVMKPHDGTGTGDQK